MIYWEKFKSRINPNRNITSDVCPDQPKAIFTALGFSFGDKPLRCFRPRSANVALKCVRFIPELCTKRCSTCFVRIALGKRGLNPERGGLGGVGRGDWIGLDFLVFNCLHGSEK